ncbi:MAG TPA: helix-turn-helix transcriptional regulator [Pseudonocardiaceae bacterium]
MSDAADAPAGNAGEVAALLRSRRARLRPADVGLPAGARRRTPGLRREEVAQLASISTTYYTFLEQGRDLRPSRQVLDALARALRLGATERVHLHELVHGVSPAPTRCTVETLAPAVADLVDRLDPHPTYVTGRSWDVLAANRAARTLWTDWPALPPAERNMLWWTFMDPAARTVLIEWQSEAAAQLARFRVAAARHPDDPSSVPSSDGCTPAALRSEHGGRAMTSPRSAPEPSGSTTPPSATSPSTTWSCNWRTTPSRNSSPSPLNHRTKPDSPNCSRTSARVPTGLAMPRWSWDGLQTPAAST